MVTLKYLKITNTKFKLTTRTVYSHLNLTLTKLN